MCFRAPSHTFIHPQVVFRNSLFSSLVEAEMTTFSNAMILLGTKLSVNSFAAMGIIEKTKHVYQYQVRTFKIGIISLTVLLSFSLSFLCLLEAFWSRETLNLQVCGSREDLSLVFAFGYNCNMNPTLKSFNLKRKVWESRLVVFRGIKGCGRDGEDCLLLIILLERIRT